MHRKTPTFDAKEAKMKAAMVETKKGMTGCVTKRGKTQSYMSIQTEYGHKPVPHK